MKTKKYLSSEIKMKHQSKWSRKRAIWFLYFAIYLTTHVNQAIQTVGKQQTANPNELYEAISIFQERLSSRLVILQLKSDRHHHSATTADLYFQIGLGNQLLSQHYSSLESKLSYPRDASITSEYHAMQAIAYYKVCLLFKVDNVDAYINLAMLSPSPMALQYYYKALDISPTHLQCRIHLGLHFQTVLKDYNKAIQFYKDSIMLHPNSVSLHYNLAKSYTSVALHQEALRHYQFIVSSLNANHLPSWINFAVAHHQQGNLNAAMSQYFHALHVLSFLLGDKVGNVVDDALEAFVQCHEHIFSEEGVLPNPFSFDLDHILDSKGKQNISQTFSLCKQSVSSFLNDVYTNLLQLPPEKILYAHDLQLIFTNVGIALMQKGDFFQAMVYYYSSLSLVHHELALPENELCRTSLGLFNKRNNSIRVDQQRSLLSIECTSLYNLLIQISSHIFQCGRAACFFSVWAWFDQLHWFIDTYQLQNGMESSLLPFDTLGLPVTLGWRKIVAERHAMGFNSSQKKYLTTLNETTNVSSSLPQQQIVNPLVVSFLSQDFADHPTAHMVEGLFVNNRNKNHSGASLHYIVYSYGKNNTSTYRRNIQQLVGGESFRGGNFFDLSGFSNDIAIEAIRGNGAIGCSAETKDAFSIHCKTRKSDIVYDLQGFTLGGRPELIAARLAPIQVNYLVFPGTSGSPSTDYSVGDQFVTPPEDADQYTEKLSLLPHSYQANYYKPYVNNMDDYIERGSAEWKSIRQQEGLPTSAETVVFANFNKQDKFEPDIFSTWVTILSRVPNSIIWLLEPSHRFRDDDGANCAVNNLLREFNAAEVSKNRIVFAPRVAKALHLRRMLAADLFLDTYMYGAHSTASDALFVALPVLTLVGDTFTSRVGLSLLENVDKDLSAILVMRSVDDYISTAVNFAEGIINDASFPRKLRRKLFIETQKSKLFDDESYTKDFNRMSKALQEVYLMERSRMHVVVI